MNYLLYKTVCIIDFTNLKRFSSNFSFQWFDLKVS